MLKYRFLIFIVFFIFSKKAFSQQEVGLHFMDIWQTSKTNPAYISDAKIVVGLPQIHLNYYNTGGAFNSLIVDYLGNENSIRVGNTLSKLEEFNNRLRGVLEIETINLGYRLGKIQLGFSHAQKTNLYMDFPKTLAKLFFEGNSQYIGETVSFDHDINLTSYNEFGFSGAIQLSKLTVGARVKYLTGIANAYVDRNQISLFTDSDVYQLTLNADYRLNTSSLIDGDDLSNFSLSLSGLNVNDLITKNSGVAIDLGVTYQVSEKLKVAASIVDLGSINWSENVKNYASQGSTTYEGFDFTQFVEDDSVSFESALDTLQNSFDFEETSNSYSTTLPTKIYLSASYQLNKMIRLGGLFYNEIYEGNNFPIFALSANAKLTNLVSVGGVYSGRKDSLFNLGINFALKLGPAQLFGSTDNILAVFQPYESSNVNFRTGLNLLF